MSALLKLQELLFQENVLRNPMSADLLGAFLTASDYDVLAALIRVRKYAAARLSYPELFGRMDVTKKVMGAGIVSIQPKKTPFGVSVIIITTSKWDADKVKFEDVYATLVTVLEHKVTEVSGGVIFIWDQKDFGFKHGRMVKPKTNSDFMLLCTEVLPITLKKNLNVNTGILVKSAWALIKPLMKKSVTEKTFFIGKDRQKLFEHVSPEALPEDLGGLCSKFDNVAYYAELLKDEETIIQKWESYQID